MGHLRAGDGIRAKTAKGCSQRRAAMAADVPARSEDRNTSLDSPAYPFRRSGPGHALTILCVGPSNASTLVARQCGNARERADTFLGNGVPDKRVIRQILRRMLPRLRGLGLAAALALAASTASAQVLVVLSDTSTIYREAADELQARLAPLRGGHLSVDRATVSELSASPERTFEGYELIVTVGLAAAQRMLAADGHEAARATLSLLVPRRAFEDLVKPDAGSARRQVSAIYLDQPISRQLDLIALAMRAGTRVGVLFGPTSVGLANELREAARVRGLTVKRADVAQAGDLYPALQKVLRESDVLLALADPVALNASTIRGILVTSYREGVPVMGFSQALVDAGAVLAVYSTARQQGREGAEIAARVLRGERLPPAGYPLYFTVGVNFNAARGLGVAIDNEATLAAELAMRESKAAESPNGPSSRKRP